MSLDIEIRSLLRSNEVKQINFILGGLRVSGHGYHALSECFSPTPIRHRIRVTVRPELVPRRASASYQPIEDKINLRSADILNTLLGRGTVLHECTHALMDLRGHTTPIRSDEGAAYLAEAWYRLACGDDVVPMALDNIPVDVINIAISARVRAAHGRGVAVILTAHEINRIRRSVAQLGYSSQHYTGNNGIRGHIYRGD